MTCHPDVMRAKRGNVIPIAHPPEDDLIASTLMGRVLDAANKVKAGQLMLTDPTSPGPADAMGGPTGRTLLQQVALTRLRDRFHFHVIAEDRATTFEVVQLQGRLPKTVAAAPTAPAAKHPAATQHRKSGRSAR